MTAATTSYDALPPEAIPQIAALFGAEPRLMQDDQPEIGPIWSVARRSENGNLRLLLWPQLARVDLTCGPHSWIARGIQRTELIQDLEVIFRFGENGLLTIAPSGHAVMVAPAPSQAKSQTKPSQ